MKKFMICVVILISSFNYSQVRYLNDPSIVAQHKRMVFERWGDFRPYPNYVLGVQTNFAYATIWGWLSPSINRDYKDGADIRPLKANGLEVQRLIQLEVQKKETDKIKVEVDSLYKRNLQDFAHWTSLTVEADPLWLLYYNRMLKPLREFPDNPKNFYEWQLKNNEIYQTLISTGTIKRMQEELDLLKDKYKISRTVDMPRGKRFIMYHQTLMGWRKLLSEIYKYSDKTTILLDYKKIIQNSNISNVIWNSRSDKKIVEDIMNHYKNKF